MKTRLLVEILVARIICMQYKLFDLVGRSIELDIQPELEIVV